MVAYHTPERIFETWQRAEAAGINTMVTNNETPHVIQAVREYRAAGGPLQWIGQLAQGSHPTMLEALDDAAEIGAAGAYLHGGLVDMLYASQDEATLRQYIGHARSLGMTIGTAAHAPEVHDWVNRMDLVDFHVVPFYNCGSLHNGAGHGFQLGDIMPAVECIQRLEKPCIGYKIMGAGRVDAKMSFEFAFANIKPGDVVNVGMHRGDNDNMVEENVAMVEAILGC